MALGNTLSSVESSLSKIFGILDKTEAKMAAISGLGSKFGDAISKVAAGAQSGGRGGTSGGGMMPTSLGNVPPVPGGGERVQANFSGPGGGGAGGGGGGGVPVGAAPSRASRGAAVAAGVASAAYNLTPGLPDSMALMGGLFPTSFAATGGYDRMATGRRIGNAIGVGASGALDPAMATTLAAARGFVFSPNDKTVDNLLKGAEFSYVMTGMSNSASMAGLTDIYRGASGVNDRLLEYGINSVDSKGNLRDLGGIVNQILKRQMPEGMSEEEFNKSLAMGYIGQTFNYMFGDSPELYAQAVELARVQVKAGGKKLMLSDGSALKAAQSMGLEDSPYLMQGKTQSAQFRANVEASEGLQMGAGFSQQVTTLLANIEEALIGDSGILGDILMTLKGGFQGTMGGLGRSSGGEVFGRGTSTHDNVHAVLAAGEYVINARAASMIGRDQLDRMNSLGQEFGAGFASPAPVFLSKGGQPSWANPFPHADVGISSGFRESSRPDHAALDLNIPGMHADTGKSVHAIAAGKVSSTEHSRTSGGVVRLTHDGGYESGYHHLAYSSLKVKPGDSVLAGQLLGLIGAHGDSGPDGTGSNSSGAHLHLWVKKNGQYIDPTGILNGSEVIQLSEGADGTQTGPQLGVGDEAVMQALVDLFQQRSRVSSVQGLRADPFSMLQAFSMRGLSGSSGRMMSVGASAPMMQSRYSDSTMRAAGALSTILPFPTEVMAEAVDFVKNAGSTIVEAFKQIFGIGNESAEEGSDYTPAPGALDSNELLQMLQRAGFQGERLREAWAIVMRESNGRPGAHNPDRSTGDNSYGLFQINMLGNLGPERLQKFKRFGVQKYEDLFDPWKNIQAAAYMSQKGNNWSSWVSPMYGRASDFYQQFPSVARKAGLPGYSHGSEYISRDQVANLHQGEMVMPAAQAQIFREILQETLSGARGKSQEINITLNIDKASDEEAERFAKKVISIVKNNDRRERMATL